MGIDNVQYRPRKRGYYISEVDQECTKGKETRVTGRTVEYGPQN